MPRKNFTKNIILLALFLTPIFFLTGCNSDNNKVVVNQAEEKEQKEEITEQAVVAEEIVEIEDDQENPQEIVELFMQATLGTLPNAAVDYDKAKTMMTSQYAEEFTTPMFIPQAYGIQDGPDRVEFEREDVIDDTAEVVVIGYWGEDLQMRWKFELEKEDGLWKISLINPGQ